MRSGGVKVATGRVINSLIEMVNTKKHLPKYLVVTLDKDIVNDLDVFQENAPRSVQDLTSWVVRQIDMVIRHRRQDILEKRPGALPDNYQTKVIYVKMLRRIGRFHENSRMAGVCNLRAKFNDALNDAVAKTNQYI